VGQDFTVNIFRNRIFIYLLKFCCPIFKKLYLVFGFEKYLIFIFREKVFY